MICLRTVSKFCKDDISLIENYDKAMADTTQTWCCHHRDEVKVLPSGITVIRSKKDLIETGRYYDCPANELIFLTRNAHQKLHNMNRSGETKRKCFEAQKGRIHSEETRKKISKAMIGKPNPNKGKTLSAETRKKLSEAFKGEKGYWYGKTGPNKGKTLSEEQKKKIAESMRAYFESKRT